MRLAFGILCCAVVLPLSQAAINRQSLVAGMPIRFEKAGASYTASGSGWSLALTHSSAQLTCLDPKLERAAKISMRMLGQDLHTNLEPSELLPGATNYFVGGAPPRTGVAAFSRVTYRQAYPGIDLAFYGSQGRLEYDFILAPGADPSKIRFELSGSESLHLSEAGDLILHTEAGDITWRHPAIYQQQQGLHAAVAGGFRLEGKVVSFDVGAYDKTQPLVIDPVLSYATYLGGSANEMARGIAVDGAGNIYVTGFTTSPDLPVTAHPIQAAFGGHTTAFLTGDAYVAKFTSAGALSYLTYLGGAADDAGLAIAVDSSGSAYVTGTTNSPNFPVTTGALQSTFAGTGFGGSGRIRGGDAFVSKLSPDGSQLMYSTYLGGRLEDLGIAIAVDASGAAYVAGATLSQNFPTTAGVIQASFKGSGGQPILPDYGVATITAGDAFVTKLDPSGAHMIFSTLLGGSRDDAPFAIAVDATGNVYIGGYTISGDFPTTSGSFQRQLGGREPQSPFFNFGDGFVAKLNPIATTLIYSTYFGGSGDDAVMGLAIDKTGNAYITGSSSSRNLPVSAGAFQKTYKGYISLPFLIEQLFGDAFVAKLNPSGSGLVYCTYLGGSVNDMGLSIAVDSSGNAFVGGWTDSTDFPVSADAAQHAMAGDGGQQDFILFGDGFLSEIDPTGSKLLYGTFFGGTRDDLILGVTLDGGGNLYAAGNTLSGNLPVTAAAAQRTYAGAAAVPVFLTGDSFVTKYSGFGSSTPAVPKLASVTNAASNTAGTVSPGMIFVGYGSNLGPAALTYGTVGADGRLDNSQSGIHILFDGDPAPLLYVLAGQLAGTVPYSVAGKQTTQVVVKDDNTGQQSAPLTLQVQAAAPGLFSADSSGHGQGAFLNEDASANSSTNPAKKGSVIVIYATGEGQTKPAGVDGLIATGTPPKPVLQVSVTIGGLPATIEYVGGAPAQVAGLMQVNARMSTKVGSGNQQVVVKIGSFSAQGNVTVAVK